MIMSLGGYDDHRGQRGFGDRDGNRTEMHAGEAPAPAAADDDQLGLSRFLDQPARRTIAHDPTADADVGIAFLPPSQPLAEDLTPLVFVLVPVHAQQREDANVAPGMYGDEIHSAPGGFVEGHGGRRLRRR